MKNPWSRELKPGEMHLFIHGWSRKLQKQLKLAAAASDKTLKDIITEACKDWLRNKKGK
jgi:hypothetical protein